jgi:hypothetical protein
LSAVDTGVVDHPIVAYLDQLHLLVAPWRG